MNTPPPLLAEIQFQLLASMAEGVNVADATGKILYVNAACERMFGYDPGELIGEHASIFSAESAADNERIFTAVVERLTRDHRWVGEFRNRRKDGTELSIQARISSVWIDKQQYFLCVQEDVTRRKQAEQALSVTQGRLQKIAESDVIGIIVWDINGSILEANDKFLEMVGYSREDLGRGLLRWSELTPEEYRAADEVGLQQVQATGRCEPFEKEYVRKDGTRVPILIGATTLEGDDGRGVSFVIDLTRRKQAEQSARAAERRFEAFMDNSHAIAFIKDEDGRHVYLNKRFQHLFVKSLDDWYGRTDDEIWPGEFATQFRENDRRVMAENRPLQTIEMTYDADGSVRHWQVLKFPFLDATGNRYLGGTALDITEQIKSAEKLHTAEEHVRQAQKMEAVGRLAGGIAHDFNNLLTIINGCSELLLEQLSPPHPCHQLARDVSEAGERATALTRQLLAFSRRQVLQPKTLDVNAVLLHLDKILRRALGADVEIDLQLGTDLGCVRVDPVQLDQAIINLAVNARDAMPQGGRLILQTRTVAVDENAALASDGCAPGNYIRICVVDTGHGMDGATLARIFEPFFTTKQAGKGTGLGLAMVYGFVRQSGGQITVESTLGEGTRFVIDLPCFAEALPTAAPPAPRIALPKGSETVLVVDDEEGVRAWTRHVLESCGYRVIEASHGAQALAVAEQDIDLLVTDVVMPKMSGRQVADALLTRYPEMKVLYVSGYTDDAMIHRGAMSPAAAFLQKPFSAQMLAGKVRALIDQARIESQPSVT
jgi:two-component system cell cycle sensor histidine kinase/response regulator CckA